MKITIAQFSALISTGLLAGAFVFTLLNLVPTFYEVPVNVHLIFRTQLMNHNGITMQILMGLAIITPLWYALLCRRVIIVRNFAILSAGLALASLLVTRFGNVPINQLIRTWVPADPPGNWQLVLSNWDIYHGIRTATAFGCFLFFILATHLFNVSHRKSN